MKTFEITLTGSGTLDELSSHLLQLSQALDGCPDSDCPIIWVDSCITVEITEE